MTFEANISSPLSFKTVTLSALYLLYDSLPGYLSYAGTFLYYFFNMFFVSK